VIRVQGAKFEVYNLGLRIYGPCLILWGQASKSQGEGFAVRGLGFGI